MISIFTSVWENVLEPLLQRPKRQQVAALCYRGVGKGKQVLLVTSRGTGRWIIPKGWPIRGKNGSQSAMQEAWEEAGVREGTTGTAAIGSYTYDKQQSSGWSFPVETMVYPVAVETLEDEFPEVKQRERKWVSPRDAANLVQEPELKSILRNM
ncbi:NUDIX hydrolase [Yoonia sp.]|jgi:8-oxo-dGTP pyrophosphatase MutT (NUDIX family)|uniref:NUDIX hydrolase n=1 Tax=Yoonia sp. TaxID=2212373 RepID=UPI0023994022|nr:NUDIX hydrolase [Yoonia sp.]MDE0850683.1 NUDIX hydrolase [Yoonia sp.]